MTTNPQRPQFRRTVQAAVAMIALISALVTAGSNSTTLSNGAELTVTIDSPVTSTEFEVPPGVPNIDVPVTGSASVGLGEPDATFIYVIDTSGSTGTGGGTGCSPILECEKDFFTALNAAVAADGSTDEVGIVNYGDTADDSRHAQWLVAPRWPPEPSSSCRSDPNVNTAINSLSSASASTNCTNALQDALTLVNASSNSLNTVLFASDGLCNARAATSPRRRRAGRDRCHRPLVAIGDGSSCMRRPAHRHAG